MSKIKENFFYNTITQISMVFGPLVIFPYVTRVLGPENYGLVSFANSFIQYFIVVSTVGVPFYGIREIAKQKNNIRERSKVFYELLIIHFVLSLIAALIYFSVILFVDRFSTHSNYFMWGVFMICIFPFNIYWFFTGVEDFKYVAIRTIALQFLQILLIFLFVRDKNDGLIFFLIPVLISIFTVFFNLKRGLKYLVKISDIKKLNYKKHYKSLLFIFFFTVATSMYELLDSVILGIMSSNSSVSFFNISSRINKIPITFIGVLSPVLMSRMSFISSSNDNAEMSRLINKSISFTLLLAIPLSIGLFVLAPEIISVFSGKEYLSAIKTLQILSPSAIILGISTVFLLQVLIPLGKDKIVFICALLGTFLSVFFNLLLIPSLDYNGAAITNVIAEIAVLIVSFYVVRKYIKLDFDYKAIFSNFFASIIFFPIINLIRILFENNLVVLVLSIILCCMSYFIMQYIVFKNKLFVELLNGIIKK